MDTTKNEARKIKPAVKRALHERLKAAADGYIVVLLDAWGLSCDGLWVTGKVGDWYEWGSELYISMSEAVYCVENDVSLQKFQDMQSYLLMAAEFDLELPDIESWHTHRFRRMPAESLERLQTMKLDLEKAIEEEKERINNI